MQMIYVSHPYGGDATNAKKVDVIVRALQAQSETEDSQIVFVSPIHAIRCDYHGTDYIKGLSYCIRLLKSCDAILMTGNWRESTGCVSEYFTALALGIDVIEQIHVDNPEAQAYIEGGTFD